MYWAPYLVFNHMLWVGRCGADWKTLISEANPKRPFPTPFLNLATQNRGIHWEVRYWHWCVRAWTVTLTDPRDKKALRFSLVWTPYDTHGQRLPLLCLNTLTFPNLVISTSLTRFKHKKTSSCATIASRYGYRGICQFAEFKNLCTWR